MNKIEIYTMQSCPYCQKAKRLLKSLNLEYDEIDVNESFEEMQKSLSERFSKNDISTVPQIIINDTYIGGYDDLEAAYTSGGLKSILL